MTTASLTRYLPLVLLALAWEFVTYFGLVSPDLLPSLVV